MKIFLVCPAVLNKGLPGIFRLPIKDTARDIRYDERKKRVSLVFTAAAPLNVWTDRLG
ncbi:MAG: hypothetical protein WAU62_07765 [Dehalococcoidales bacterium]